MRRVKMWAEEDKTWKSLINLWNETSLLTCCRVHFWEGICVQKFHNFYYLLNVLLSIDYYINIYMPMQNDKLTLNSLKFFHKIDFKSNLSHEVFLN